MNPKLRVAVIGCGAIARHAHVPAWLSNTEAEIVAICDQSTDAMSQLADKHSLKCRHFQSLDELLAKEKTDIVDICTPGHFHLEHATKALEAGCHTLVEKPPAPTVEAATRLVEIALSKGLKLGAIFNYRYRDVVLQFKQHLDQGLLGELVKVSITHHGPVVFGDAPWLWNERESKYLLWEFGIHFIDLLVHLLGPHVRVVHVLPTVQPSLGHTTDLDLTIEFSNGRLGKLEITADSTRHSTFFTHIYAYGTAMDAFIRWFPPTVRLTSGLVNPLKILLDEARASFDIGTRILRGTYLKQRNITHYRVINAYVDWIRGRSEYPMAFQKILPTLKLLKDIEQYIPSYRAPGRQPIPTQKGHQRTG